MLIEKQTFLNAKAIGASRTFADLEPMRCEFTASHLANFDDSGLSLVVRDVVARRPVVKRSGAHGVRFENVLVEGLTGNLTQLAGCVFRHVTLRGRSGSLMIVGPNHSLTADVQQAFTDSTVKYYQDVDCALDITEAEFVTADLYYLPAYAAWLTEPRSAVACLDGESSLGGLWARRRGALPQHQADRHLYVPGCRRVGVLQLVQQQAGGCRTLLGDRL
jgi:hypothetical protein